ncbi:hypothetical protein C9374_009147 [Naegleria lovaniensis]|uniref:Cdc23 domain-containing protein n=1 Tax=Naegleria lovaniensis TaxID=51637 RepID=A0AA88GJI3_NAELO|nr:uncharacterized protein C9374_009147 [Naegleria lovaniensis]KAG2377631.1 hypothetical protein C9374_009147 [Naegleria lovaniensis]
MELRSSSSTTLNNGTTTTTIREDIRRVIIETSERGLIHTSKWLGEQVISLPIETLNSVQTCKTITTNTIQPNEQILYDHFVFAKTLFESKEYARCSFILQKQTKPFTDELSKNSKGLSSFCKKCLFLEYYSLFLSGEQMKEQEVLEYSLNNSSTSTTAGVGASANAHHQMIHQQRTQQKHHNQTQNKYLRTLLADLKVLHNLDQMDSYLYYIFGIVLKEMEMKIKALDCFIKSVNYEPLMWGSWMEIVYILIDLMQDTTQNDNNQAGLLPATFKKFKSNTKQHWMMKMFKSRLQLETLSNQGSFTQLDYEETTNNENQTYNLIQELSSQFPYSNYLFSQLAMLSYHQQDFQQAQEYFEHIKKNDPYRLECLDTYSNILYVREEKSSLSKLAHQLHSIDKYRVETCCVIGNYYSLRGEHEKAVLYFKRALSLDPKYLSAWTLMGHEYIEMKNTKAAVNAYRSAVEIQSTDYRAWYGLGQTYEMLDMSDYALYYYSKSCSLRPYDGRMWAALANCYESLEQYDDALKCYQRAFDNRGEQLSTLLKMANIYRRLDQNDRAVELYLKCLGHSPSNNVDEDNDQQLLSTQLHQQLSSADEAGILLFLADYYYEAAQHDEQFIENVKQYCMLLMDDRFTGLPERDSATQLLHSLNGGGSLNNTMATTSSHRSTLLGQDSLLMSRDQQQQQQSRIFGGGVLNPQDYSIGGSDALNFLQ